jgi:Ax21 family sulfation-dependent quorum factor
MKRSLIALALAALLPISAQASELSYSYIEGGYVNIDGDADGFGVRGSINFGDSNFYGLGRYANVEIDGTNFDIDLTEVGLGYHHGISDKADFLAEVAYTNADTAFGDADGYRASVGFRGKMSDNFEGLFKANYSGTNGGSDDFSATLGAQVKFNETWGVTGEVEFADNANVYLVGVRASF